MTHFIELKCIFFWGGERGWCWCYDDFKLINSPLIWLSLCVSASADASFYRTPPLTISKKFNSSFNQRLQLGSAEHRPVTIGPNAHVQNRERRKKKKRLIIIKTLPWWTDGPELSGRVAAPQSRTQRRQRIGALEISHQFIDTVATLPFQPHLSNIFLK